MKKNILFLIESLKNGGSERSICNIMNEIIKKHNVVLVVATNNNDYKYNGKIIEISEFLSKNPLKRLIGIRKLKLIKKKYKIDITISYLTAYNFYNILSKHKDKTYISIRNHLSTKKESISAKIGTIYANKKANKIICCANAIKEDQINNFKANKNKIYVIENFTNIKNNNNKIINNNTIITIGRLTNHKGQEHIIKAMNIVNKKINNSKLIILGTGNNKTYLENLVKKYSLNKAIKFIGFTNDIEKYLSKAKIFVLASDYEGFSNALLEAMSCHIPIIATNSPGGNKEILEDGKYGILIPSFINEHNKNYITNNEKILAEKIIKLLTNKDYYNYYKNQAKERSKYYNKSKIIKKWLKIIEEE